MTAPRQIFLVLGGARSGKTRHALSIADRRPNRIYLATAQAFDDEMRERISQHQRERDATWTTHEEPHELANALHQIDAPNTAIVVDCLTLWLSNMMLADQDITRATDDVISSLKSMQADVIFVSNEVGLGIVPDNKLAREFRDAQGLLNQRLAAVSDQVEFIAAGLPLTLKSGSFGSSDGS